MDNMTKAFARNLKEIKTAKDVSFTELSAAINIPRGTLYNYASCRNSIPLQVAFDIARYFGKEIEEMLTEKGDGHAQP